MLGLCLLAECLLPLPETQHGSLTQQSILGGEGTETARFIGRTHSYSLTLHLQKVLEEWPAQTSYDVGLEAERAALEKQETQDTHQEQVTEERWRFKIQGFCCLSLLFKRRNKYKYKKHQVSLEEGGGAAQGILQHCKSNTVNKYQK